MTINNRLFGNEEKYVKEVLASEFRSSTGSKMMRRFEEAFSNKFGMPYGISFINGTATMHAALEALEIGPGDEVIVPPLTMSATTFAVLQANATPVFADVNLETFQIDPEDICKKITKKTKAIITVALYGLSPEMGEIMKIAASFNLKVVEDNAECFLGYYKEKLVGTLGHCSSFSFQSSKHLTSGEGGILLTKDLDLAEKIRKIQSLGYAGVSANKGKITKNEIQDPDYDRHVSLGWNYRMPELCCAVALAQTENIEHLVKRRIEVANLFNECSRKYHEWFKPQYTPSYQVNSYWTWVVNLDTRKISWHDFKKKFTDAGGDGVYAAWKLTYLEPMFQKINLLGRDKFISQKNMETYKFGNCKNAEYLQPRLVQFKTNYWDFEKAVQQAEVLEKTLKAIN
jgi:perosamine synthetase